MSAFSSTMSVLPRISRIMKRTPEAPLRSTGFRFASTSVAVTGGRRSWVFIQKSAI